MKRKAISSFIVSIMFCMLVGGVSSVLADVPNPLVTGPIPVIVPLGDLSRDYPQMATQLDLASHGYVEEEYFLEGLATQYDVLRVAAGVPASMELADVISTDHPYKTRMIVRRPISAKDFNGTVIMEWLNVTSGYNLDAMWLSSYAHLLREGYAYVGVSVQRVGIHAPGSGLREWSPVRYGSLDVTDMDADGNERILDDALSFDIWSQAAKAIWSPQDVDPLGGLRPLRLIAAGASQSQYFLVWYHNSIHPLTNLFDGYLMYIGVGRLLRTDLDTKVIKVNTENDVIILGEFFARQPDSDTLRTYEVAGTSHVGYSEPNLRGELLVRDGLPIADISACALPPFSRIPTSHVANAAFDHLTDWITYGIEPPTAPLLEVAEVIYDPLTVVLRRDAYGNAVGGIQLSQHAVPTATNTGFNYEPDFEGWLDFCILFGSHEPFDEDTLRRLYRNHGQYTSQVMRVVNENLADGYIVKRDAIETRRKAAQSDIGKKSRR